MTDPMELVGRLEETDPLKLNVTQLITEAAACIREMVERRPIETAPKDGKCIVWCATDDGGEARVLDRDAKGNWLYEGEPTFRHGFYIEPTHWLPLPPAPGAEA